MENVGDYDKKIRGEGVPLPKTVTATDPGARYTVQDDGRVTRSKDVVHPLTPQIVETPGLKNGDEADPVDGVKRFAEVNFENHRRGLSEVAATNKVSGIDNVFGDAPPGKEPRLIRVNQGMDGVLQARSETFSDHLSKTILEGDRAEVRRATSSFMLRQED